jgi:transposase
VRIGLEAGPLSQRLYAGMKQAGLVELLETRHVRTAFRTPRAAKAVASGHP